MSNDQPNLKLVAGDKPESRTAREKREIHERFLAKQATKEEARRRADAARERLRARAAADDRGLPRIQLHSDPESIRALVAAINNNLLPDVYVRAGQVVTVEAPSGTIKNDEMPPLIVVPVDTRRLTRLLADHTYTYEMRTQRLPGGDSETIEVEVMPKEGVAHAVLATTEWPKLQHLAGIVTAPVFRPDGTLVQQPGYDETTGLIYAPKLPIAAVPDEPTVDELRAARRFLRDELLHDFPWVLPSRANYIGMLIAPLMRSYLGGDILTPLGAIDAASPSSGKTLLTLILLKIYSGYTRPWVTDDIELRKVITSILIDQGGAVVVLDNVGKGHAVDQASLSSLLTTKVWSDRILGASTSPRVPNDRVWFVTGNALEISGDNASRSVPMRLDANMPNPELRPASKFALGDLESWLETPENAATILHHLLVLMRGWINDGARRIETPMRGFTVWASATAGFLDWLHEPGFMTNRHWLVEADEEEVTHGAFYARWHALFGSEWMKPGDLRASAVPDAGGTTQHDWRDAFLVRKRDGQIPSSIGLGKMLSAEKGRFRCGYRLVGQYNAHTKSWEYAVLPPAEDDETPGGVMP